MLLSAGLAGHFHETHLCAHDGDVVFPVDTRDIEKAEREVVRRETYSNPREKMFTTSNKCDPPKRVFRLEPDNISGDTFSQGRTAVGRLHEMTMLFRDRK